MKLKRIESKQHVAIADATEYMEVEPSVIRGQNWSLKNNRMEKRNDKKNLPIPMEVDERVY